MLMIPHIPIAPVPNFTSITPKRQYLASVEAASRPKYLAYSWSFDHI